MRLLLLNGYVESGNCVKVSLHTHPRTVIDKNFGYVKLIPLFSKLNINGSCGYVRSAVRKGRTLIGAIPTCLHLNILRVSSVKTQLIYCQL
jgi:hypothetical protein